MKNICLLGSTGSIGRNTLDVVRQHHDRFRILSLAANRNIDLLAEQISEFKPQHVIIFDQAAYEFFVRKTNTDNFKIWLGNPGLVEALNAHHPDVLVNAFVGFAGLKPTIEAIQRKIFVALANKETLVVAGSFISSLLDKYQGGLMPIDSEHSAIWQCLTGEEGNKIKRIILTASGGPFLNTSIEDLAGVTAERALKHPNWKMGAKITIDSATLMNKGLEVIEAFWLYKVPLNEIEVVIHPQSIIHSMVEFEDHSIKAQLGIPDMRIPIQYAISYPDRFPLNVPQMSFKDIKQLTFDRPDFKRFPCLGLAYEALESGRSYPAVLNAANEMAVEAFLEKKIGFMDISRIISEQLAEHSPVEGNQYEDYLNIDRDTRRKARDSINKLLK